MAGTVHTEAYSKFLRALVEGRSSAGLSQAQLALRLDKPASFVGKYELGERRLDVIELLVVLKALKQEPTGFIQALELDLPERL